MLNPLELDWPPCLVPKVAAPEVQKKVKAALGFVPNGVEYTGCVPWVCDIDRLTTIIPVRALDGETTDLCALAGAHATTCRHCYGGARAAMLLLGYSDAQVHALSNRLYGDAVPKKLAAAADFVRKVVSLDATAADVEAVKAAGFSAEEAAELAAVAAFGTMYSRINTPLAVPPPEVEKLQQSFVAPLIGFFTRRSNVKVKAWWRRQSSSAAEIAGPFADLVAPLLPSPAARELRGVVDACLASTHCPRPARLLAMAVVGRAGRAEKVVAGARQLLDGEGVPAARVDAALDRLESEDAFERALLQYARASVSYQRPAELQQASRSLIAGRPTAQVIDAIGAVALANGLTRLSVLSA